MTLRLHTIIASTRPGRVGPAVGAWFQGVAEAHPAFDARLVDLADFALPVFDEPNHPRSGKYVHDHTKAWSESVAAADAFVFVTPEYNFHPTPALVNALTYLAMVKEELGDRWLRPDLFRFGASSLLGDIERQLEHHVTGAYSASWRHAAG